MTPSRYILPSLLLCSTLTVACEEPVEAWLLPLGPDGGEPPEEEEEGGVAQVDGGPGLGSSTSLSFGAGMHFLNVVRSVDMQEMHYGLIVASGVCLFTNFEQVKTVAPLPPLVMASELAIGAPGQASVVVPEQSPAWLTSQGHLYYSLHNSGVVTRFTCTNCLWDAGNEETLLGSVPKGEVVGTFPCGQASVLLSRDDALYYQCDDELHREDEEVFELPERGVVLSVHNNKVALVYIPPPQSGGPGSLSIIDFANETEIPVAIPWDEAQGAVILHDRQVRTFEGGFWVIPPIEDEKGIARYSILLDGAATLDGYYPRKFAHRTLELTGQIDEEGVLFTVAKHENDWQSQQGYEGSQAVAVMRSNLGDTVPSAALDNDYDLEFSAFIYLVHRP